MKVRRRWIAAAALAALMALGCGSDDDGEGAGVDESELEEECAACGAGQACVHSFDGWCLYLGTRCIDTDLDCAGLCTAECEAALCRERYSCRYACVQSDAFVCNGP
jgi:hypothetical protein